MESDIPGICPQCFGKACDLSKHQFVIFRREMIISGRSRTGDVSIEKSKKRLEAAKNVKGKYLCHKSVPWPSLEKSMAQRGDRAPDPDGLGFGVGGWLKGAGAAPSFPMHYYSSPAGLTRCLLLCDLNSEDLIIRKMFCRF